MGLTKCLVVDINFVQTLAYSSDDRYDFRRYLHVIIEYIGVFRALTSQLLDLYY
jgi:hypothetical protein